ncbi:nuclear transport factor 2 family protein [Corynebacterium hylobatis]|uniref:Nuclear transport factor 2 family protein n=1 Tax=Corynebacterium hylobatis TaxID=1859290 RepID=A0A3S0BI08_9CORY|nr:nuclear transport factor 2 family protein [Corynebacterium hylobatis]RSZ65551.1 nuclear transport factor 2 family protein [Corynebacterium hylobatis]
MDDLTLENLMDLERQGWEALSSATGWDFYGRLMTAEGVMLLVNGMVLDRTTIAATLNESPAWASFEITPEKLVPVGTHAATLVYRAVVERPGQPPFEALMASTYVLLDGVVRLALYQQTTTTH